MTKNRFSKRFLARKKGYRSGLEDSLSEFFKSNQIEAEYEKHKIKYEVPATKHTYTPDFKFPNGIFCESKGRFVPADRKKHLYIREQYPELDIRFIFERPNEKISKVSKTTYADWCNKNEFKYCGKNDHETILQWAREVK
jgi:hypothetical protein